MLSQSHLQPIGAFPLKLSRFSHLESQMRLFKEEAFQALSVKERWLKVNEVLLQMILQENAESFLLAAVLEYLAKIQEEHILSHYHFSHFEYWLNHLSGLSEEENRQVRAQIAGKYIPREDYQLFFPTGMGKIQPGPHFIAAHISPDTDTTI
ncbi:MAG: hypothetical protein K0S07_811, partial [Chlamydiales bacterium]|nr:hypothetical protein [Chlamydiales bacterium]